MVRPSLVVLEMSLFPAWCCQANVCRNGETRECLKRFKSWEQGHRWLLKQGWEVCEIGPALYVRPDYTWQIGPAMPAPFPTKDNGQHIYFEDEEILVFNNHGNAWWGGMAREDGGYQFLVSGQNPEAVMRVTREARALPRDQREAHVASYFVA